MGWRRADFFSVLIQCAPSGGAKRTWAELAVDVGSSSFPGGQVVPWTRHGKVLRWRRISMSAISLGCHGRRPAGPVPDLRRGGAGKVITDRGDGPFAASFGFVEMANDQEAPTAIDTLNGTPFRGRPLTVNEDPPARARWRRLRWRRRPRAMSRGGYGGRGSYGSAPTRAGTLLSPARNVRGWLDLTFRSSLFRFRRDDPGTLHGTAFPRQAFCLHLHTSRPDNRRG